MAGWIALRFLNDPTAALAHFAHVDDGSTNPIVLARAGYWRGRAEHAAGRVQEARASYEDAQAMLLIGKTALARGLALDPYAFPTLGVPHYRAIGPDVEPSIVYSVVRTESGFDPRDAFRQRRPSG